MSPRRRLGAFVALLVPLVLASAYLALRGAASDPGAEPRAPSRDEGLAARGDRGSVAERAHRAARRAARRSERRTARALHAEGEPGPPPAVERLHRRAAREAVPVARRFFAAFARHELGERGPAVASALRETATVALARSLLRSPPRGVPGARAAVAPARLRRVEFVATGRRGGRELRVGEVVGTVVRAGRRGTIALRMRRGGGGWRVAGLGL